MAPAGPQKEGARSGRGGPGGAMEGLRDGGRKGKGGIGVRRGVGECTDIAW
jgi:hypothetical protein